MIHPQSDHSSSISNLLFWNFNEVNTLIKSFCWNHNWLASNIYQFNVQGSLYFQIQYKFRKRFIDKFNIIEIRDKSIVPLIKRPRYLYNRGLDIRPCNQGESQNR